MAVSNLHLSIRVSPSSIPHFLRLFCIGFVSVLMIACHKNDDDHVPEPTPEPEEEIVLADHLNSALSYETVTDIDGNLYATISIGDQVWMADNLRTTRFCNGDSIFNIQSASAWGQATPETPGWAWYDNNEANDTPYGKLYNWYAVGDERNVCPCGWHVPSMDEWGDMYMGLGGPFDVGPKLRSANAAYWGSNFNESTTNSSGFSALPAGWRDSQGGFMQMGHSGYWCTPTEFYPQSPWAHYLSSNDNILGSNINIGSGLAVRCVKD